MLNLFYKSGHLLAISVSAFLLSQSAQAVTISTVYSSACVRETGVIINVDNNRLQLMTLSGEIRTIPRFDIIYIASYPVGSIQIPQVLNPGDSHVIRIHTLYNDQVVTLVEGWMIDYSEDQISFLTLSGIQAVIDTDDIWDLEIIPLTDRIQFDVQQPKQVEFMHPYPFMHCQPEISGSGDDDKPVHRIYPQSLLSEPLLIKRELDRLKEGYDTIRDYSSNKRFYPVPQLYANDTSLGVWINAGNRYGSSKNRGNSFIPSIVSETSDGPFGYQSIFVTGSAPMFYSIHEEPQMQAYFRMKASYVHFSIMVDFSRFTMGADKYKWSKEGLESNDDRVNEIVHLAGGFDYGAFAIDVSVINFMFYAVRHEKEFHEEDMNLNRGSLSFHNRHLKAELHYGFAEDRKASPIPLPDDASGPEEAYIEAYNEELENKPDFYADFVYYRLNLDFFTFGSLKPTYSLIYRDLDFEREQDGEREGEFLYASTSLTNALYLSYPLNAELKLSGYLSWEQVEKTYGITSLDDSSTHGYPKGGLALALLF